MVFSFSGFLVFRFSTLHTALTQRHTRTHIYIGKWENLLRPSFSLSRSVDETVASISANAARKTCHKAVRQAVAEGLDGRRGVRGSETENGTRVLWLLQQLQLVSKAGGRWWLSGSAIKATRSGIFYCKKKKTKKKEKQHFFSWFSLLLHFFLLLLELL